jgi:hypothetical protein
LDGDVLITVACGDARLEAVAGRLVREYKIDNLAYRKAGYSHLGAEGILIADQQCRAIKEDIDIGGALVGEDHVHRRSSRRNRAGSASTRIRRTDGRAGYARSLGLASGPEGDKGHRSE